jgi:hypothetical protein
MNTSSQAIKLPRLYTELSTATRSELRTVALVLLRPVLALTFHMWLLEMYAMAPVQ